MILVTFTALLAVCSADKLDRTYLPPPSAQSAGGSPGSLQAPFATKTFNQGLGGLPHGGFSNEHDGVVVEAAAAGTRSSEFGISGLGAPRINYGSFNSKVGDAAFKEASQQPFGSSSGAQNFNTQQNFGQGSFQNSNARQDFSQSAGSQNSAPQQPERPQAAADRAASTVKFESDVDSDKFNYAFETDNGITAEENGVDSNGIQAQGGFSYTGDDGQVYSITYTADEGGYKPQGSHLPTAPPIPKEILESLEKNAQDEAAGIIDDGSYDAQKYNAGSEYTESENDNSKYNGGPNVFGNRRESAASASGSFNQNTFSRPGQNSFTSSSASFNSESGASSQNRPISNSFRPSAENQDQSGQPDQPQPNGVRNQNLSFNSKPSSSIRPQASAFNNGAQFISQAGNTDMKDSDSNGAEGLLNVDKSKDKPALGNYNGFNSQQNIVNRPPGFVNSQFSSSFASNTFSLNSNKPQTPNRFSSNNEYLPPKNSFQSSSNNLQGSIADTSLPSSQNIQSSLTFTSPFNQANRQTQQQNSFQQNSASAQDSGMFSMSGRPISSNLMSQNVNNRFNYQQPTLQPDTSLTTPFVDSSSFSSNSQSSVNSQYSRPVGLGQMTGNSQISNSMSTNIPNYEQQSQEFPKRVTSSASASASFSLQAAIPTSAQATSSNQQNIAPSFQFNKNQPALGRPSAINENGQNIVSQNYATGTNQPSISQISQYQDSNDAYYYNQPGQSFKTPTQPSLQSNQLNQFSQQTATGGQGIQSNAFANQGPSTTVTYPSPQTVAPTVPTSATQNNLGLNQVPQFSGITQATATSFVSNMPSLPLKSQSSTQQSFSSQSNKFSDQPRRPAFEQRPTTGAPSFLQLNQQQTSQNINERPAVTSQQFTGEIYQYNKPPQVFPAPDAQSDSEKNTQFQIASSMAEGITGTGRPQFGLSPVTNEQSKGEIYDYKKPPQNFPASAEPTKTELNTNNEVPTSASPSQTAQQAQFAQVSYQQTKPASANQQIIEKPSLNKQPSDGSSIRPICCKSSLPTGSISSPTGSASFPAIPSIPVQSGSNAFGFQGTQSSSNNLAGRGEVFSESRKPPSYDPETGYHY